METNKKFKKANVINENEKTLTTYDNEMFRPTIDQFVKGFKKVKKTTKKN